MSLHGYCLGEHQLTASCSFFYKQALNKFNAQAFAKAGYPAFVRQRIQQVATQEATVRLPDLSYHAAADSGFLPLNST